MIETLVPEALIAVEPVVGFLHGPGLQPAGDGAAVLGSRDQTGGGQHVEVLHDRRQRHGEGLGQFTDGNGLGFAHAGEQRAPGWVRQSGKGAIEWRG